MQSFISQQQITNTVYNLAEKASHTLRRKVHVAEGKSQMNSRNKRGMNAQEREKEREAETEREKE